MTTPAFPLTRSLPAHPSSDQLKKQAKELLRAYQDGSSEASALVDHHERKPDRDSFSLVDAQRVLARSYGFASWPRLKHFLDSGRGAGRSESAIARFGPMQALRAEGRGREAWMMICAAIRNDTAALRELLAEDPDRARLEIWYTPPIYFAVREGCIEATRMLWEANPQGGLDDLIEIAQERGHAAIVAYLHSIRPRSRSEWGQQDGRSDLHRAVIAGDEAAIVRLLEGGAVIDAIDNRGFRPIHYAYWRNEFWVVRDRPALATLLRDAGSCDSIVLAAARGDVDRVRLYLIDDPSLADESDSNGKRALSAAAERGHQAVVALLLEHGANPNAREGRMAPQGSALMGASIRGDVAIAKLLLEHGADPNAEVDSSGTPANRAIATDMQELLFAAGGRPLDIWVHIQNGDQAAVETMLQDDPDPFATGKEFSSTPYTAIISGCARAERAGRATEPFWAMLDLFIGRGFPLPTALTACRDYLFHVPAMTRVLLEQGLDPNIPDWFQRTPLHSILDGHYKSFTEEMRLELLDLFIEFRADLDAIDADARSTPLGCAARSGRLQAVRRLLQAGADPQAAGASWATPLAWAKRRGHEAIAELLRAHGARD